jgi:hypothetical protein
VYFISAAFASVLKAYNNLRLPFPLINSEDAVADLCVHARQRV